MIFFLIIVGILGFVLGYLLGQWEGFRDGVESGAAVCEKEREELYALKAKI